MSGTEAVQYIMGPMWTINGGREPSRDPETWLLPGNDGKHLVTQ